MFIEFQVGNYKSFRDIQRFTMQAAPLRTNDSGDEEGNVFTSSDFRLLKSKAIYGSNASGKSNLVDAFFAFGYMVTNSVVTENLPKRIWKDSFKLITDWGHEPMFFQYIFLSEGIIYRYGFQILENKIIYEWLFEGEKENEKEYFMRSPKGYDINKDNFKGAGEYIKLSNDGKNELFRNDALFLTSAALNGNIIATKLRNLIKEVCLIDEQNENMEARQFGLQILAQGTDNQKKALINFLNSADTGIENLELIEIDENNANTERNEKDKVKPVSLFSSHIRYDENGNVKDKISVPFGIWESQGTAKLFGVAAVMLDSLTKGVPLIIDEFDSKLHPNLTLKIVELYHSKDTNPHNAQLIFVTHDTGLLRRAELRRDQICIVNKDKYGISTLSTLIEFKGVRKDASYEKEYLNGNYEGVPYLGEMDSVVMENNERYGL